MHEILRGLSRAQKNSVSIIDVYSDSTTTIKLIMNGVGKFHILRGIVENIKRMIEMLDRCVHHHILREGNTVADSLVKFGAGRDDTSNSWVLPPNFTLAKVLTDRAGVHFLHQ